MLKTITIHKAAQLMTDALVGIEVPSLAEFGHDPDDDRWFFQTMSHRNGIVDAIKAMKIRAVNEFSLMPTTYYKEMPDTQPIRWDDFLAFTADLGITITEASAVDKGERNDDPTPSDKLFDWIKESKKLADQFGNQDWNVGIRQISARSVCDRVAMELQKNTSTFGQQGPRSNNNVRTIGLRGWKFTPPTS